MTTIPGQCILMPQLWSLSLPPPCSWDASGSSPIHLAVENGHAEVIALLIKADASLGAVDKWNVSV